MELGSGRVLMQGERHAMSSSVTLPAQIECINFPDNQLKKLHREI